MEKGESENIPVTPSDDGKFDNFLALSADYSEKSDKQK